MNNNYCLDISEGINKCFAIYMTPEPGGRTKSFLSFVDLLFDAIIRSDIIESSLAMLRIDALETLYPDYEIAKEFDNEEHAVICLNDPKWYDLKKINYYKITEKIFELHDSLHKLPRDFPLAMEKSWLSKLSCKEDFERYYKFILKKGQDRLNFIFNDLVLFFTAASFNGSFILLDDFERIPNFQTVRQMKDFAIELRSYLFDGISINAKIGFYNIFIVLHAGVPRLISDAWDESGMNNRAPIDPTGITHHIIPFERLTKNHANMLIKKYLSEFRIESGRTNDIFPFTQKTLDIIGERSEYNAAKILTMAYMLIEEAASREGQKIIDTKFVSSILGTNEIIPDKIIQDLPDIETVDLIKKACEDQ